ncbi:MAG: hypothetical protein AAFR74_04040, partial [Pseudomonadota bacterium]
MLDISDKLEASVANGRICSYISKFENVARVPKALWDEKVGFPPILQAAFQLDQKAQEREVIAGFEQLTLELRDKVLRPSALTQATLNRYAHIKGEDLKRIISDAAETYNAVVARGYPLQAPTFHFQGIIIEGDLDLSDIELPSSLRLIACHISGCLNLARAKLTTLDLSGSVIKKGVSAPHVTIKGALRLRRTVVTGILDFGAAEICGPMDAADSVCVPVESPPQSVVWVSDRSAVNFGLAQVGKEMRLNRVRWFGGLNLRSIKVAGSLFLTDAIIRSPIAVAEKIVVESTCAGHQKFLPHQKSSAAAERDIARLLHGETATEDVTREALENLSLPGCPSATLGLNKTEFDKSLLGRLLFESARVQTTAIRGDGAIIDGVFSADSMRIGGRVRLKKIQVQSALTFSGGHFRTFRSIRETLATYEEKFRENKHSTINDFCNHVISKLDDVDAREPNSRRQYAIDLRRAKIGASVEFRKDSRKLSDRAGDAELAGQISGVLCTMQEDPSKFLQVFYGRPGEVNEFIDANQNRDKNTLEDEKSEEKPQTKREKEVERYRNARTKLRKIGRRVDGPIYETIDFESEREEKLSAKSDAPIDDKYRPDFPPARVYERLNDNEV